MDEARFRSLIRDAVGEPPARPWLPQAVRARIAQPLARTSPAPWFAAVAVFLALTVLALAFGPRLLHSAPTVAIPSGLDPSNCTLPVIVYDQIPGPNPSDPWTGGLEAAKSWGFVSTRTGRFTADPSASPVIGMPTDPAFGSPATPARTGTPSAPALTYSHAAGHWIPVPPERLSPDGLSYVYLGDSYARTLMRYDIATGRSVKLWQAPNQIGIIRWTARGIFVGGPMPGTSSGLWLVNPLTGVPTALPPPPGSWSTGPSLGTTAAGDLIHEDAVLNGATVTIAVYYYDTASGKRVLIYQGTGPTANLVDINGVTWHKGTGFDPGQAVADSDEIWFSTLAPSLTVWHWDEARGLGKVDIGLVDPQVLTVVPAGPCF